MRLRDLVKGGGRGAAPPREVTGASRKLSDLVRKPGAPAPPVPDSAPAEAAPPAAPGLPPEEAPSAPTAATGTGRKEASPPQEGEAAQQVLSRAADIVEEILQAVRSQAPFSISNAGGAVEILLQSLEASDALLALFFSAGSPSPSPAQEAVNVSILSVKIGLELGYPPEELRKLGLAALLCDVGIARVPPQILGKQDSLTPDERAVLENHQREGAKVLQKLGPESSWLAAVVETRYAKTEGPRHPENRIEEFAAIIRLADIYESLVHHRPFRQRVGPLEALKQILQRDRRTFPDRILKTLLRVLINFPVGSLVRLSTGEIGRVVAKNKDLPLRPVVEVLVRRGRRLEAPIVIDLSQSPLHHIQDAVVEEALP